MIHVLGVVLAVLYCDGVLALPLLLQGKTAYDVAMEAQNKFAMDTIAMGRSKTNPQGMWELVTRQPVGNCGQWPAYSTYTCRACMHVHNYSGSIIGASPHRGTHSGRAVCHIIIIIYIRWTGYRIFLNVSTRFFFTVTSRHFTGHTVQSSSSWTCSLTSLLEADRGTEVSHHSLRLLLLCSVE